MTQTQPLPAPGRTAGQRGIFRRLATLTTAGWVIGGGLVAAQYTAAADYAPRLVRGAAWFTACLCLLGGAACFAGCTALAVAAVAVHLARAAETRWRILNAGAPTEAAEREHFTALAAQAASVARYANGAPQGRLLRLAGTERRLARRDLPGA